MTSRSHERRLLERVVSRPVTTVFVIALVVRVVAALVITIVFDGAVALDDVTYSQMAMQAADGQTDGWDEYTHFLYSVTATFLIPLTMIFKIFGSHALAGQLFVGLLGAGAAALTARVGREFLSPAWALAAGLIVALLPSQIIWSSAVLKDASVWLILVALALCVAIANRRKGLGLLWIGLAAALLLWSLAYLRLHSFVIASWALALAAAFGASRARVPRMTGAFVIAVGVPWLIGAGPAGADFVANAGSLEQRRLNNAIGANSAIVELVVPPEPAPSVASGLKRPPGSGGRGDGEPPQEQPPDEGDGVLDVAWGFESGGNPIEAESEAASPPPPPAEDTGPLNPDLRHLPRGIVVMLLEPLPGRGGSTQLRLASTEAIIWYPLLALAALGLFRSWRRLATLAFPILAGGGVLVTYALTEGNIGTAFRHRGELVWVVALLAASGLADLAARRKPPADPAKPDQDGPNGLYPEPLSSVSLLLSVRRVIDRGASDGSGHRRQVAGVARSGSCISARREGRLSSDPRSLCGSCPCHMPQDDGRKGRVEGGGPGGLPSRVPGPRALQR